MTKNIEKLFFTTIMAVFISIATFHFIRLSLNWEILINGWNLPTLISGFIIVVSIFITYWAWITASQEENINANNSLKEKSSMVEDKED